MKDVIDRCPPDASRRTAVSRLALALSASVFTLTGNAAGTDAELLGTTLTPLGGEIAGSEDGVIPAWVEPGEQAQDWSYGKVRGQHWVHRDDKPLFSIDASNYQQYVDQLNPGQVEMFKQMPGYRMDIYPTRRTCSAPDFVAENTKRNVGFASLDEEGLVLEDAYVPGIPFAMPTRGAEVIWNMKMRYRGVGFVMSKTVSGVSPRKGTDDWLRISLDWTVHTPWAEKGSELFSSYGRNEFATYFNFYEPVSLAGQAGVITLKAGQDSATFYYFPGQRRVRRMPAYSYDAPQIGLDNQYTIDESNVFSGVLDRFDWKLVGKKALFVPYNAFGAYDTSVPIEEVTGADSFAPEYRRYELHRVWVVEANVREGMRHQAPHRLFYIDEDSWNAVAAVDYDRQGNVWKVREGYTIPVYETGTCDMQAQVQHNLPDGRYLYDQTSIGVGERDHRWLTESEGNPRMRMDFYTSDNLRAISDR